MFSAGLKARLNLVGMVTHTRFFGGEQRARVEFATDDSVGAPTWFLELPVSCFDEVIESECVEDTGPEIVSGSVVRLKSGGPKMTVESIRDGVTTCTWYDDYRREVSFAELTCEALEIAQ